MTAANDLPEIDRTVTVTDDFGDSYMGVIERDDLAELARKLTAPADEIVRALAAKEPVWWVRKGSALCALCEGANDGNAKSPIVHEKTCPWLRAKNRVGEQA